MGWEPHIVAELDPTGFHEVPVGAHECLRRAVDNACPRAGATAPSAAWMAAVDRFLAPTPVASSR